MPTAVEKDGVRRSITSCLPTTGSVWLKNLYRPDAPFIGSLGLCVSVCTQPLSTTSYRLRHLASWLTTSIIIFSARGTTSPPFFYKTISTTNIESLWRSVTTQMFRSYAGNHQGFAYTTEDSLVEVGL